MCRLVVPVDAALPLRAVVIAPLHLRLVQRRHASKLGGVANGGDFNAINLCAYATDFGCQRTLANRLFTPAWACVPFDD
jgi:hypothetical protein